MGTIRNAGGDKLWNVGVVGATGLVGRKILQVLAERAFPVREVNVLASAGSVGSSIPFADIELAVLELHPGAITEIDIAFFSAGAGVSRQYARIAVDAGALVIDNSSAFRMEPDVPLAVPEVNPGVINGKRGIIANPNCSTIQLVVALKPLHDRWRIRRVVVSTYQSVSGAGQKAVAQLESEIRGQRGIDAKFPHPIAYNALPQVDLFEEGGNTREELKMLNETRKILGDPGIALTATCVRIPTTGGHSESVNIEFEKPFDLGEVRALLAKSPGIIMQDEPGRGVYPMPITAAGRAALFVGRLRRDTTVTSGLNLWIVSDNLRKGAATNAVQIAECWIRHETNSSSYPSKELS